ncbi:hypothetical protein EK21DRAFT_88003 [Setomelanomma holmii]|uniref:Heterokaryon incompatibility domain-containing protein n=1 Tax=Setomelanomma holmii TaxID=210430 RepID=A0A9P4HDA7_9PLEO|nr:hypothetical protein EK21DRAFT_88003 [Setomelanomma holmii]
MPTSKQLHAHAAIINSGKLCTACASISFKPLAQTGYTFRPNAGSEMVNSHENLLFYFHHCCIACVNKASIAGCRLCALFLARLRINVNIKYDDKLGSALALPGAGVWVVLTQRQTGVLTASDGRIFAARSQQTNWGQDFTFHYDKFAAKIDLTTLPDNLEAAYRRYPERNSGPSESSNSGLTTSVAIAKAWFETCHNKAWGHIACRPFGTEAQTLPKRVIEIGVDVCELILRGTPHYDQVRFLPELKIVEMKGLSRTIQHAIDFTRALGFQHLWVDALCVVQDDNDDQNRQFAVMGDIYKRSALTLAAAAGSTADTGLFVERDHLPRRPCPVYEEVWKEGKALTMYAQLPDEPNVETPLDSRGWVFQEDMLATRTLKFCLDGLRWSCASFWMSESTPRLQLHPTSRPHTVFREWIHKPDWKPSHHEALDSERHFFEDWYEAVASYTDRELTKSSDKLPALAGLAQQMASLKHCTYVQGLWEEDMEYGMLWYVGTPLQADPMHDALRGVNYWQVAMADSSTTQSRALPLLKPKEKKIEFMNREGMSLEEEVWLALKFLSIEHRFKAKTVSTWSWAYLEKASIRFLYSPEGLTAQGTPVATCLHLRYDKGAPGNPFVAAKGGHMLLKGALEQVDVIPQQIASNNADYEPTSMTRGKWVASLMYRSDSRTERGYIVGYAALDEDPEESGLAWQTLTVLLMRDDTESPSDHSRLTPSGYLKRTSMVPLTIPLTATAAKGKERRWTTALLLKKLQSDGDVYQRIGLCQMYHWILEEELKNPAKRQNLVVVV